MQTWLFVSTFIILVAMVLEISRLIPQLLRGLKFESQFVLPDIDLSVVETCSVSVIVPAKDEAPNIIKAVESILASSYKNLEVILVNDRSTDDTWELMRRLSEKDNRIKIVDVKNVPDNWTGKTHAMFVGTGVASGDIFLFTDADAVFSEDLIARAVKYFSLEKLDLLSLIPGFQEWGFLEKGIYPHMALVISYFFPLNSINDPNSEAAVASGCFIMISAKTYRELGTWSKLKSQLTEDIAIARMAKSVGKKICVGRSDMVRTKAFSNVFDLARFWRRTFYGALDNNLIKIMRLWLNYTPLLIPFGLTIYLVFRMLMDEDCGSRELIIFFMSVATIAAIEIPLGIFLRNYHGKWAYTFLAPVGILTGSWIATWLFFTKVFNVGIEWRGSIYKQDIWRKT